MLQTLKIKNVALIKELEIDFEKGFNVLLGETGAGKSIIFDALNFVLGAKADKGLLRTGEEMMRVDAVFTNLCIGAVKELMELGALEELADEISLTRTLDVSGKSTARINGNPATSQMLKACSEILVDSYSQHESMDLLKSKNHLVMLDKLCGQEVRDLKNEISLEYEKYQSLLTEIKQLGGDEYERERTKSLLEYQIKEIEDAQLIDGEDEEIKQKLNLMTNSEKIVDAVSTSENLLEEGGMSAISDICGVINLLNQISGVSEINACVERLNSCRYELQDISETLKDLRDSSDFDEGELDRLDRRNDLIKSICKKYGGSVEKALAYLQETKVRLDGLNNSEARLAELEKVREKQEALLNDKCEKLSKLRQVYAKKLEAEVMSELKELGMKSTTFVIKFTKLDHITAGGFDEVEFAFSANKGQEIKALAKTASGGEMSRVMLAFKTIFAGAGLAQTLIFDEIDTGISGEIGYVVGEKLFALTGNAQVICVTHLAQVASQGDVFYFVSKSDDGKMTFTNVKHLSGEDITLQLARMLGGDDVTEVALAHIKEMRKRARKSA